MALSLAFNWFPSWTDACKAFHSVPFTLTSFDVSAFRNLRGNFFPNCVFFLLNFLMKCQENCVTSFGSEHATATGFRMLDMYVRMCVFLVPLRFVCPLNLTFAPSTSKIICVKLWKKTRGFNPFRLYESQCLKHTLALTH